MIVVNISQTRSDAIIVTSDRPPLLVPLPDATPGKISMLTQITNSATTEKDMKDILKSLWSFIVHPIVKILTEDVKLERGSRIWWCPTGAASLLPLHAAGDYTNRGETVPDQFVSSYTSTLSALIRARTNVTLDEPADIIILGQSQDPTLPTVRDEIEIIQSIAGPVSLLDGSSATRESSLRAMTEHSWIHLACHGNVDEKHPFKTHFSLYGGPLTLLDIATQNIPRAHLAFLSSCHSAEGNRERPDEVLHLTAAVPFAGFQSVVGTLWAVDGKDGPAVSQTFYQNLLGSGPRTTDSSAVALHRAVTELRKRRISATRWACFVHYGS